MKAYVHVQEDNNVAENAARAEATQKYHQALFEWQTQSPTQTGASPQDPDLPEHDPSALEVESRLGHIVRVHRPTKPSSALAMERYLTLDASSDPFPLYTKKALSDMGVDYGSLATVQARSEAAKKVAGNIVSGGDEECEIEALPPYRRAQSAPIGHRPRVNMPITQLRRAAAEAKRTWTS